MEKVINSDIGLVLTCNKVQKKETGDYLKVFLSCYHGDADYNVNEELVIDLTDLTDISVIKELVYLEMYHKDLEWDDLKESIQNLFKDVYELDHCFNEYKNENLSSYSECHDEEVFLNIDSFELQLSEVIYEDFSLNIKK